MFCGNYVLNFDWCMACAYFPLILRWRSEYIRIAMANYAGNAWIECTLHCRTCFRECAARGSISSIGISERCNAPSFLVPQTVGTRKEIVVINFQNVEGATRIAGMYTCVIALCIAQRSHTNHLYFSGSFNYYCFYWCSRCCYTVFLCYKNISEHEKCSDRGENLYRFEVIVVWLWLNATINYIHTQTRARTRTHNHKTVNIRPK